MRADYVWFTTVPWRDLMKLRIAHLAKTAKLNDYMQAWRACDGLQFMPTELALHVLPSLPSKLHECVSNANESKAVRLCPGEYYLWYHACLQNRVPFAF